MLVPLNSETIKFYFIDCWRQPKYRWTNTKKGRQAERQANKQMDKQYVDRQTYGQTDR